MTIWTIKGEKGMTGTVEQIGYLLWHITSPVKLDIAYGGPDSVPGTYVDALGRDQMVAIEKDVASKGVFLDENYTGDLGEKWYPQDNVTLTYPNGTDYTARVSVISVPPSKTWTIKGEKGMTGTVEQIGYLSWHITSPVKLDIGYGGFDAVPGTYVDALGRDQMVAIEKDVASKGVFLDENYTGDLGERWYPQDMVTVTNIGDNATRRVLVIGSKTWTINGEKGMTGFVEKLSTNEGLLWHITSPVTKTLYYGGPNAIPGTYVDSLGRDQMAVLDWEGVFFDENYTGDLGEKYLLTSQVTITYPNGTTSTARIAIPTCVPAWKCEIHLTGFEEDGCGNRRANPACVYREAVLASCQWPLEAIAGQAANVTITVNQGSLTENYKLVFSGDVVGESTPFIVDAGAKQQQFTIGNLILTTGGTKNVSATLIKV